MDIAAWPRSADGNQHKHLQRNENPGGKSMLLIIGFSSLLTRPQTPFKCPVLRLCTHLILFTQADYSPDDLKNPAVRIYKLLIKHWPFSSEGLLMKPKQMIGWELSRSRKTQCLWKLNYDCFLILLFPQSSFFFLFFRFNWHPWLFEQREKLILFMVCSIWISKASTCLITSGYIIVYIR